MNSKVRHKKLTPLEALEYFWSKADKSGGDDACWEWTASKDAYGYGTIYWGNYRTEYAHRLAWKLTHGDPAKLHVLHHYDNPGCVNPSHLWLGTHQENMKDKRRKGRSRGRRSLKLTDLQVAEIRKRHSRGNIRQSELAKEYGVSSAFVHQILNNKRRVAAQSELRAVSS